MKNIDDLFFRPQNISSCFFSCQAIKLDSDYQKYDVENLASKKKILN